MLVKKNTIMELVKKIAAQPKARVHIQLFLKVVNGEGIMEPTVNNIFPEIMSRTVQEYV